MDRFYLRVAKDADPETGQITFLGEIPEGAQVQITQAIRDQVIDGVNQSVKRAWIDYPGRQPSIAMLFSSTGRGIVLGTKTGEEVRRAETGMPSPYR